MGFSGGGGELSSGHALEELEGLCGGVMPVEAGVGAGAAGGAEAGAEVGIGEEGDEGVADGGDGKGIDEKCTVAGDLRERAGIGGEAGDATGHGLGEGEAEALVEGGVDDESGAAG